MGYQTTVTFGKSDLKKLGIYFAIISVCSLILLLTLNKINFLDYKKPMTFNQVDQIKLSDFRGYEFFQKELYGNKSFAYIVTTIESSLEDNHTEIWSEFHPSRSYVFNRKSFSPELLKHEVLHFKITELYTRKIKEEIAQNCFTNEEIKALVEKYSKDERAFQAQYDLDTFHSYIYNEQLKYQNKVDSLLLLLQDYTNNEIQKNESCH